MNSSAPTPQQDGAKDRSGTDRRPAITALAVVEGGAPHAPRPSPGALDAFLQAIGRLEQIVDQETQELQRHQAANLRDFNHRKSHGLLDLSRAMRGLGQGALDLRSRARLDSLRAKLDINRAVLSTHLAAAREVTVIISRAIQEVESDGTYSSVITAAARTPW